MRLNRVRTKIRIDEGFHILLEAAPDAIVIVNDEGHIVLVNAHAERMFGYPRQEMLGQPVEMLMPASLRDAHHTYRNTYLAAPSPRPMGAAQDLWAQRKDGSAFPVEISLSPLPLAEGMHVISSLRDITLRKRYERDLEEQVEHSREHAAELERANVRLTSLATQDELTGIKNIRGFWEHLEQEYHRALRSGLTLSLLMVDVDHFKQFNDTFGHPAGDTALRTVAQLLEKSVRAEDIVARYGGEEFALLLPNTGASEACIIAERLRSAISAHAWPQSAVTVSIGISTLTMTHVTPSALIEEADQALYISKRQGRDRVTHIQDIAPPPVAAVISVPGRSQNQSSAASPYRRA